MKKSNFKNRLISVILCICMLIFILPVQTYATDGTDEQNPEFEASYTTADGVAYDTLANALANVADGGTVTLLKDVTGFYTTEANINNTVTLELNGKTVGSESKRYPIFLIGAQGNLIVQDSSGKDGKLESAKFPAIVLNDAGGWLRVLSGTIYGTTAISSSDQTIIRINGGTIRGTGNTTSAAIDVSGETDLTISGGTITSENGYGINSSWDDTVKITGDATITGKADGICAYNLTFSGGSSIVNGSIFLLRNPNYPSTTGMVVESGAAVRCNGIKHNINGADAPVNVTVRGTLVIAPGFTYAFTDDNGSGTITIMVDSGVLDTSSTAIAGPNEATFTIKGNSHVRLQGNIYTNPMNVESANYYWYCGNAAPTEGYTHSSTKPAAFVRYDKYFELFTDDHLTFNAETTTVTCPHGVSFPVAASVTTTDDSTTYYTDLSAALKAATNGSTVKLLKGITTDKPITLTGNDWNLISLDLNGNTVQGTHANAVFKLIDGKTVTLKDSASGGTIVSATGWGIQVDDAELIIEDGVTIMGSSSGVYFSDGRLTVTDALIKGLNPNNGNGIVIGGGFAAVNGGTITGGASGIHAIGGTVTVTGGSILGEKYGINAVGEYALVTVNGGTLEGPYALYASGSVTLNGGTLKGRQADIVVAMPITVGDLGSVNHTLTTAPDYGDLPVQIAKGAAGVTVNPAWFTYVYANGETDNHYVIVEGDRHANGAALIDGGQANELYLYYCDHSGLGLNGVCDACGTEFAAMVIDGDAGSAKTEYFATLDAAVNAANASRTDKKAILLLRDATGDVTITGDNIRLTSGGGGYALNGTVTTQARNTLLDGLTIQAGADYGVVVSAGRDIILGHALSIESTKADVYLHKGSGIDLSQGTDTSYTVSVEDLPDTVGGKRSLSTGSHADKLSSADPNYYILAENGQTYLANRLHSVSVTLGDTPATQGSEPDTWTAVYNGKMAHVIGAWINDVGLENTLSESWWNGNTKLDSFPTDVGTYDFTLHHPFAVDTSEVIYEGTLTITKAGIISIYWNRYPDSVSYNGQPLETPDVDFRMSDGTEKSPDQILWKEYGDSDENLTNIDESLPSDVGRYTLWAMLDPSQNYQNGYAEHTVEILPAELSIIAVALNTKEWDGTTAAEAAEVTFAGLAPNDELTLGVDYTVTAAFENADAGENKNATVTVTLLDTEVTKNYTLSASTFAAVADITPKIVTDPTIELSFTSAVFTGEEIKPEVTLKDGKTVVPADEYTVEYLGNVNHGTATVQITDKDGGNYAVSGSTTFTIEPKPLTHEDITAFLTPEQVTYDGKEHIPTVTVKDGDSLLTAGSDYVVTMPMDMVVYQEVPRPIDVFGMGNYSGVITLDFYMNKGTPTADDFIFTPPADLTYDSQPKEATVETAEGIVGIGYPTVKYFLNGEEVADARDAGTYTVKINVKEGANYNAAADVTDESWTFTIAPKPVTPSITLSFESVTYNGMEHMPEVTLTDGSTEIPSEEYSVKYTDNVNAGAATVKIYDADGGNYRFNDNVLTKSFTIEKARVTITADDITAEQGEKLPELTYTVSGLMADDMLKAEPTLTCDADMKKAGKYIISIDGAVVPDNGNYYDAVMYTEGILTVVASDKPESEDSENNTGSATNMGDDSQFILWILLLITALIGAYMIICKAKKNKG